MDVPSPFTAFLIRHGETEWNCNGRWQGQRDVPLNAEGRAQAARLARRLAEEAVRFDILYTSDLVRAWETAKIVGGTLGLRPIAESALREIDLGAWAGKTRGEIAREFPDEWRRIQRNEDIARGGGETFAGFQRRVLEWLNRAVDNGEHRAICVVTHGGCIRALLLHALGLSWPERDRIPPIANGSITAVERAAGEWRPVRINDALGIRDSRSEEDRTEKNEGDPAE